MISSTHSNQNEAREIGLPPVIIHVHWIFHEISWNQPSSVENPMEYHEKWEIYHSHHHPAMGFSWIFPSLRNLYMYPPIPQHEKTPRRRHAAATSDFLPRRQGTPMISGITCGATPIGSCGYTMVMYSYSMYSLHRDLAGNHPFRIILSLEWL